MNEQENRRPNDGKQVYRAQRAPGGATPPAQTPGGPAPKTARPPRKGRPAHPKKAPASPAPGAPRPPKSGGGKNRSARLMVLVCALAVVLTLIIVAVGLDAGQTGPATPDVGTSAGAWTKNENGYYFNDQGGAILAATSLGIDVSKYQGQVDWEKAKAAGVEFAILRCGYGSEWNGEGDVAEYGQDDETWRYNADECTRLGIPFGAYLYSYATTEEMARSEADHVARLLGLTEPAHEGLESYTDTPYTLSCPVYYDLEDKAITGLFPEEMAAVTAAFFDQLESYGYTGGQGIYASLNWVRARLQDEAFDPWRDDFWIARFSSTLDYTGAYGMWQATYQADGATYGVKSETVDLDFVMEELMITGITDAKADGAAPGFTNNTYQNELWLASPKDRATLVTDEGDDGQKIYWTSSDENVATVSKKGVVKAVGSGVCTVTATLADGRQSAECLVRVGDVTVPIVVTGNLAGATDNGAATLADVAALAAGLDDSILLDAGGSVQGSAAASLTGGMDMTSAFSAAGYDLQAVDGRDLAYGSERLLEDALTAAGPTLAANLRTAEGTPLFYRSTSWNRNRITNGMNSIVERAGHKIGFFALASADGYAGAADLTAGEITATASEQVAALTAEGADAIVCIVGPDLGASQAYADAKGSLPGLGVTVIVNAALLPTDEAASSEVPAGGGLGTVARLDLVYGAGGGVSANITTVTAAELAAGRSALNEAAQAAYDSATAGLSELAAGDATVQGQTLFTFGIDTTVSRTVSFGNYVASVYEEIANADAANWPADAGGLALSALAGGVEELVTGEITRGDLLNALPAASRLVLVRTSALNIEALINNGAAQTYTAGLVAYDATEGDALLVTDTATLSALDAGSYTILRDYGDTFWNVRMAINDATGNFANPFTLPEAPTYGVGRGNGG